MKKNLLIFLLFILSTSISLAKNDEIITLEEIQDNLIKMEVENNRIKWFKGGETISAAESISLSEKKQEKLEKRSHLKKSSQSACEGGSSMNDPELQKIYCPAMIIKRVFSRNERAEIKRPGDIFYALSAIERLIFSSSNKFVTTQDAFKKNGKIYYMWSDFNNKYNKYDGPYVEVGSKDNCVRWLWFYDNRYLCTDYSKYTLKKLEKFKKNPNNEKVLGRYLIKYIHNVRLVKSIREKIGTSNYDLIGDMLNASVKDVIKIKVPSQTLERRKHLKEYSQILFDIKKKIEEDKFKSIDKSISKLSKKYKKLQSLKPNSYRTDKQVDEAIDLIFDLNKLIEKSSSSAEVNKEDRITAIASIEFMDSLIDSILSIIPKQYKSVPNKQLGKDLFDDDDLDELEKIINNMIKKNYVIKNAKMTWSKNTINKYIDTSIILNKFDQLGIQDSLNRTFTEESALNVAHEHIDNNLDKKIFKDVKKIVASVDRGKLDSITREVSQTTKEVSKIASEMSQNSTFKSTVTQSYPDPKFGGQSLKKLIRAGIIKR